MADNYDIGPVRKQCWSILDKGKKGSLEGVRPGA